MRELIGQTLFTDDLPKRIRIRFNMRSRNQDPCADQYQQKRNDDEGPTICLHCYLPLTVFIRILT
nr:hypothetical protein [Pantoea stewartii]